MHKLCLFPPFTIQPKSANFFFSYVLENLGLPFHSKSYKSNQTSYCLILQFPLASDLPHTDITHFPSTEDAGCNPFLSQASSSSEVFCQITLSLSSIFFLCFPTVLSFLPYFSVHTLFSAIPSAPDPVLDSNFSGSCFRCV